MAVSHYSSAAALSLLLLLASASAVHSIGVNYGTLGDNLPSPPQVAQFLKDHTTIDRVKIFDVNPDILRAFAGTGILVAVTIPNGEIPGLTDPTTAGSWVSANIQPFHPLTKINYILVGNEILHWGPQELKDKLVAAMRSIHRALILSGITDIKVTTAHSLGILESSDPPSMARFRPGWAEGNLAPLLQFHNETKSPFMVNPYPYFAYSPGNASFSLFGPNKGVFDKFTKRTYGDMFDLLMDAVYVSMMRLGYKDVEIAVGETGWASNGDNTELWRCTVENAAAYNGGLVKKLNSGRGTPLMPRRKFDTYIFALFNENQKTGPLSEQNFGLFRSDFSPVYDIGVLRQGAAAPVQPVPRPSLGPPAQGNKKWCVPTEEATTTQLHRTHFLPELWDHVFLPHLLHIKIWHEEELELLSGGSGFSDRDKMVRALNEQYDYHMDTGTTKFALYYKEWLKFGGRAPSIPPSVPLPSKSSYSRSRRRSSDSSTSNNKSLHGTVFGPIRLKGRSIDLDSGNAWDLKEEIHLKHFEKFGSRRRSSSSSSQRYQKPELWPDIKKSDYFRFFGCRAEPMERTIHANYISINEQIKNGQNTQLSHTNDTIITRAVTTICSSESLSDCEKAIRAIAEAWLNSHGDKIIETSLSQASFIQGVIEVLYVSTNDEILELAISILAELATKSEMNRTRILSLDPQLEISIRLLRSGSLFLKAAALLYLIRPEAKQMVSMEWIALVLRVLEFGDQSQTLFTVKCYPHEAAYYFLDELLTGFDEDRNLENARQIVALGGLSLLVRRMDEGDIREKSKAAGVLHCCVKADRSCRYYLAKNLKKEMIMSLLAVGTKTSSYEHALALLTELLCLSRRSQIIECLTGLKKGWDCLNTMHILLLLLHRARPEERPIIAVILLQLDLMEDNMEYSVYREEAIDAIIKSLDRWAFDEKTQEISARALLVLGGHFSYSGEPEIERWLLRKAGFVENMKNPLCGKDISLNMNEDEKTAENWVSKTGRVLLNSGNKRLFLALSESIANSIPCLARASLVTICWMSISLDRDLQLAACSILVPRLIECLNDDAWIEEKILASFSLYNLTNGTDYLRRLEKGVNLGCLHKLSRVTWTAKQLISLVTSNVSRSDI